MVDQPPLKIVFSEIADRYQPRPDPMIRFPEPCPVCGHPTGDCAPHEG